MKDFDVVIATEEQYIDPKTPDWCSDQVILEDQLLLDAFAMLGLRATRVAWSSTSFDWACTKSVLIRAVWDYHTRFEEFKEWALRANENAQMFNSAAAILWNLDKIYMHELQCKGVHIPPTHFFDKSDSLDINDIALKVDWKKFVLKPRISAGARNTLAFSREEIESRRDEINALFRLEDMMIQEFQENIVSQGEISIVMFGDQYSHAVIKNAVKGDFRVQDDFGGSVANYKPSSKEIEFAQLVVATCPLDTAYARVDYFTDNNGKLALGELEIIEPELWFRECDTAAELLATTLHQRIV